MTRIDPEQVKAATDIVQLVARYTQLRKQGNEYVGLCCLHNDTTAPGNLYVNPAKQVWACFACGAHEQHGADAIGFLRSAEGIDFPEAIRRLSNGSGTLPPPRPIPAEPLKKAPPRENLPAPDGDVPDMALSVYGEPTGTWTYRNADGGILGYVCRYFDAERGKTLRCFSYGRYSEADPARWECKSFSSPRPLYGLELLADRPDAQILLVEGEKAADAARELIPGMVALTWPGGANAAKYADWSVLAGRKIVLWPDNDAPGRQAMERVAALLKDVAAEVKGIDPDTQPDGSATPEAWDAADALASGWDRDSTLAWAKARITVYVAPQRESDAPEPSESPTATPEPDPIQTIPAPAEPQEAPPAQAVDPLQTVADMPEAEFPPEASRAPPPRGRKPTLAVVDGNTVRSMEIEPEVAVPPEFSEFGLADAFAEVHGADWRFTVETGNWHRWVAMDDGGIWELQRKKTHTFQIQKFAAYRQSQATELTGAQRAKICTIRTVNSIISLLQARPGIAVTVDEWDADPWALGLPDGRIANLKTGQIRPAQREDMVSRRTLVAPERGAHPYWNMVLGRASNGDDAMLEYLRLWAGCCATGDTSPEAFTYLHGFGAAGKSKYILPLQNILNDYARQIPVELFLSGIRDNSGEQLAQLPGVRLAVASEPDEGARWAEGRLKLATGRNKITCRDVYSKRIEFSPQFKLMFEGNSKPHLRGVGEEIRRRFKLVEFKAGSIPEEDRILDMPQRLEAEYPAILQWMIDGAADFAVSGLNNPEQMDTDVRTYLQSEDQIAAWMDDCCERDGQARTRVADAYESYRKWCERDGEGFTLSKKRFAARMNDRGYETVKSGERFLQGFSLRLGANL